MSNKNKLGITEGEWRVDSENCFVSNNKTTTVCQTFNRHDEDYENKEANAKLIADAGTTANKCGLLPSELLKQRDEFIEMLKYYTKHYEETNATKKLIQSIESNKCGSCNGSGLVEGEHFDDRQPCLNCNGKGKF